MINIDNHNASLLTYFEYDECFYFSYYDNSNFVGFFSTLDEHFCKRGTKNYYNFDDFQIDSQFISPTKIGRE